MGASNEPCTLCGTVPAEPGIRESTEELVVNDFRVRRVRTLGFPAGILHTVQGWKVDHLRTIETRVCDRCVDRYVSGARSRGRRNAIIGAILTAVIGGPYAYLLSIDVPSRYNWIGMVMPLLAFAALGLFLVGLIGAFMRKDFVATAMHRQALKKLLGSSFKFNFVGQGAPPARTGAAYHMKTAEWEAVRPLLDETKSKTGWSFILYTTESSVSSSSQHAPEQGAAALNVAHLGVILDRKEEEPEAAGG